MAEEHLVVTNGSSVGSRLDLDGDTFVIGRDDDTELAIDDSQASRRHARVTRSAAGFMVEDLGSTNGTFLGGSRISAPQPWGPADELRIGRTTIALKGAPARTEIGSADEFDGTVAAAPAPGATPARAAAPPPPPPAAPGPPPLAVPATPHGYPEAAPPPAQVAAGWKGGAIPGERDSADGLAGLKSDSQVRFRAYLVTFLVLALVALAVIVFVVTR